MVLSAFSLGALPPEDNFKPVPNGLKADEFAEQCVEKPLQKQLADLSLDEQTLLAEGIITAFTSWKKTRQPLEERWQACWQAYLCQQKPALNPQAEADWTSNQINRPVLYETVETLNAYLLNALFPAGERFFSVLPLEESEQETARQVETFLRQKLEDFHFSDKYALFLKQLLITGNSIAAVPWKTKQGEKITSHPKTVLGLEIDRQITIESQIIYEGPDFEVLDMMEVVLDPEASCFDDATLIRRLERRLDSLKNAGIYHNLDALEASLTTAQNNYSVNKIAVSIKPPVVVIYEAWGDFYLNGELFENSVATVSESGILLRLEPIGFLGAQKPFIFSTLIPLPNQLYGLGAIENCLGLQDAINLLTNQKLDTIQMSIHSPFTYLVNDDIFDPSSVITQPGALIPVKNHDTLRPLQHLNNFSVAFSEIADLKSEIQEATGAFKLFNTQGVSEGAGNRTATEITALLQGGAQKYSALLSHLESNSLEPFLKLVLNYFKCMIRQTQRLRLLQEDGQAQCVELTPQKLSSFACQFRISGVQSLALRTQEVEALSTFIGLLKQAPEVAKMIDITELYRRIYRRFGFKDEDKVFKGIESKNNDLNQLGRNG